MICESIIWDLIFLAALGWLGFGIFYFAHRKTDRDLKQLASFVCRMQDEDHGAAIQGDDQ